MTELEIRRKKGLQVVIQVMMTLETLEVKLILMATFTDKNEIAENPCCFIITHFHSYFDMFAVTGVRDQSDLDYGEAGNFDGGHHDGLRGENLGVLANRCHYLCDLHI